MGFPSRASSLDTFVDSVSLWPTSRTFTAGSQCLANTCVEGFCGFSDSFKIKIPLRCVMDGWMDGLQVKQIQVKIKKKKHNKIAILQVS